MRKEVATKSDLEKGACYKDWGGRLPVALGYPNRYALAMSNLGFQTIYHLLNREPRIVAERFFLENDAGVDSAGALLTRESSRPVAAARVILFSVSFEQDYVNLVILLRRAGLEPLAKNRSAADPLVLAGGVTTFINPLPLFPLVDGFLSGEGESQILEFCETLLAGENLDRTGLLKQLSRVPGFISSTSASEVNPIFSVGDCIFLPRAEVADFVPRTFVAPAGDEIFSDTLLVEVNRGCPRGCRFCAAGFVYRPFRNRPLAVLKEAISAGISESGFERVGLVGSALGDYPELKSLCRWLVDKQLSFSFSSIRIDAIDNELLNLMLAAGVKSITIAPEAGSERLRRALNKKLSHTVILKQAARIAQAGIGRLKLYFLMGLPEEREADLMAIVDLVKEIRQVMLDNRQRKQLNVALNVSINPFVPKPQTPLQWAPFADVKELKRKQKFLAKALLRIGGVNVEMESPVSAAWQSLLSRGGVELAPALIELAGAAGKSGPRMKKLVNDNRQNFVALALADPLPWAFIRHSVSSDFLKREYSRYWAELGFEKGFTG